MKEFGSKTPDTKYKNKEDHKNSLIKEVSLPNPTWADKTRKLYDELMDLCKDGKWEKVISYQNNTASERLFVRAVEAEGKMFEYAMFLNRKEQRLRAVVQFGPWLQGPKGYCFFFNSLYLNNYLPPKQGCPSLYFVL